MAHAAAHELVDEGLERRVGAVDRDHSGAMVLFIPGFMQRGDAWRPVAELLPRTLSERPARPCEHTFEGRLGEIAAARRRAGAGGLLAGRAAGAASGAARPGALRGRGDRGRHGRHRRRRAARSARAEADERLASWMEARADRGRRGPSGSASRCSPTSPRRSSSAASRAGSATTRASSRCSCGRPGQGVLEPVWHELRRLRAARAGDRRRARRGLHGGGRPHRRHGAARPGGDSRGRRPRGRTCSAPSDVAAPDRGVPERDWRDPRRSSLTVRPPQATSPPSTASSARRPRDAQAGPARHRERPAPGAGRARAIAASNSSSVARPHASDSALGGGELQRRGDSPRAVERARQERAEAVRARLAQHLAGGLEAAARRRASRSPRRRPRAPPRGAARAACSPTRRRRSGWTRAGAPRPAPRSVRAGLLHELEVVVLDARGSRARPPPTDQAPFASTRRAGHGPTASRTAATRSGVVGQAHLQLEARVARLERLARRARRPPRAGPPGSVMFTGSASFAGLGQRPVLLARVQVEPGDLLGRARLRRAPPSAARERRDRPLERHAVVGLEAAPPRRSRRAPSPPRGAAAAARAP